MLSKYILKANKKHEMDGPNWRHKTLHRKHFTTTQIYQHFYPYSSFISTNLCI